MTTVETTTMTIEVPRDDFVIDDAQLVAFLARYSGRTLDAYRHDLRGFFQWAADDNLAVLAATRPHIELYLASDRAPNMCTSEPRSAAADRYAFVPFAVTACNDQPPPLPSNAGSV